MAKPFDKLMEGLGDTAKYAITDIRNLWEEAWFGRPLTPPSPEQQQWNAFWKALGEHVAKHDGPEPSRDLEHDPEIDR